MEKKLLLPTPALSNKPMSRKMKKRLVILCGIVALLCTFIYMKNVYEMHLMKVYEIRDPRVENEQSLLMTAEKYNLNKVALVTVVPSAYRELSKDFDRSIPEGLIFDNHGNYIEYKVTDKSCNAGLFGFIPALAKNGNYKMTAKTTLNTEMGRLRDLSGGQLPGTYLNPDADYYILISWAAFTGRLNKDHVKAWENLARDNTKAKIQIIEVNMDAQDWWPQQSKDSVLKMYAMK